MTERLMFTKRRLESLPIPTDRVTYHYDREVRGLRLAVHPSGRRTFSLYRKFRRRPLTYPLGEFPHVSIDQARHQASEKIALMGRGVNPRDELDRHGPVTLGEFFKQYLDEHTRRGQPLTERQRHDLQQVFDRYLAPWRKRPLEEITRHQVERLIRQVGQPQVETIRRKVDGKMIERTRQRGGPVAANRLLALLSSVFSDAQRWEILMSNPPTRGIEKFPEQSRRRLLDRNGEFTAFLKALDTEHDPDLRLYLKVRLYNGVRERNILAMRWQDLDLDRCTWRIGETKNGDPLLVPLANPVLDELRARARAGDWVFPGRRRGAHLRTLNKRWRKFRAAVGLVDVQLRDLRRTFGSRALAAGVPMDVIAQMMGHKPGSKVTASVYALADEELKREAIAATTQKMLTEAKTTERRARQRIVGLTNQSEGMNETKA